MTPTLPSSGVPTPTTARRRAFLRDVADHLAARPWRLALPVAVLTLAAIAVASYPLGVWLLNASQGVAP